jgi:hypothetical protein
VSGFVKENEADAALGPYLAPLKTGLDHLQQATMWFMQNAMAKPDNAGAGSTDYMHLLGLVALGYMWAMIAKAAQAKRAEAGGADGPGADFYEARLTLGRYFMERTMPETAAHLARIQAGAATLMALPPEAF